MTRQQKRTEAACGRSEKATTHNYCFQVESVWIEGESEADARLAIKAGLRLVGADVNEITLLEVE